MSSEAFRNSFLLKLSTMLPAEKLKEVLYAFDVTSSDFDISRKKMDIIPLTGTPEVVKIYIASKAIANLSANTLYQYRYKLINFFNAVQKPFQDITANDVRMFLYGYKTTRHVSDAYIDVIRRELNCFFDWLVKNEYLIKNPMNSIEKIKYQPFVRQPLTPYELEVVRWSCQDIREKALIDFFFSTGCRVSECADVNISDIDWQNRSVIIRHGKGDKRRIVFFNAEAELTLRKYIEQRTDNYNKLFVGSRKPYKPLSPRAIEVIIQKIGKRCGIKVYPHKLRHTFATVGLRSGMPLEQLQALMGHEKPETTLIYAKLDNTELQREHSKIYL